MTLRKKLNSGYHMPIIGISTWGTHNTVLKKAIPMALASGYRSFDCADLYDNQDQVGKVLKKAMQDQMVDRADLFIISKLWNTCHRPEYVEASVRKTLEDLQFSYLDLLLMHWPISFQPTFDMRKYPCDERGNLLYDDVDPMTTWKAMEKLVLKGLVRSIGVANFNLRQLRYLYKNSQIIPSVIQVECHPFNKEELLQRYCWKTGIVFCAFNPFATSVPGSQVEDSLMNHEWLLDIAESNCKSVQEVILRWLIQRNCVVMPHAGKWQTMTRNKKSIFTFSLNEREVEVINTLDRSLRVLVPMVNGSPRDEKHPYYPRPDESKKKKVLPGSQT